VCHVILVMVHNTIFCNKKHFPSLYTVKKFVSVSKFNFQHFKPYHCAIQLKGRLCTPILNRTKLRCCSTGFVFIFHKWNLFLLFTNEILLFILLNTCLQNSMSNQLQNSMSNQMQFLLVYKVSKEIKRQKNSHIQFPYFMHHIS
jgi:hypothetical protein